MLIGWQAVVAFCDWLCPLSGDAGSPSNEARLLHYLPASKPTAHCSTNQQHIEVFEVLEV